ncbi:MAG: hypothetical protein ACE5KM_09335, partial [Planctomycetaceae bacterium]
MARILSSLPGDLSPRLARLESHVRHLKLLRGIGSFGVVVVTAFAVGFLLDICFEFSVNFRLGLLAAVLGTCAVGFVVCVIRPLSGSYTAEELAAVVETAHPELRERLTSTIELNDPGVPERDKGSRLMRLLLAKETARSTASMNFNRSVSQRRMLRASVLGFAAVIVLLAPFVLSPDGYGLLWARFFAPWKNYDAATNLYFDVDYGNGVVAKGSDVTITAEPNFRVGDGKLPKEVFLNLTDDENNADRIRMDYDEETQTYSTTVSHVFHSFQFDVSADRTRTKRYDIRVVEAPAITAVQLDVRPPPYTGRKAEHVDGVVGTIDVFENSICTLTVRFNKAVESAKLEWLTVERPVTDTDPKKEDAKPADATPLPDPPSKLVLAADHKSATLTMIANAGGQFAVKLTDEYGLNNDDPANRRLTIVPDRPPELTVDANATQLVRPRDVVPVIVGATDDVGVGAVELHIERPDGHKSRIPVPPKKLGGLQVAHTFRVDVSRFQLQEGESLKYRVRAADDRMVPDGKGNWLAKPHIIWSDLRSLTIDKKAKAAETDKVAAKQKALKDTLTAIRKDLVKNRDTVDGVRKEADEDNRKQLKFQGDETIGKLADEQSRLSQRIEDLAGQFGQHPLFGNLTKKLQEVARQDVAPAGRQLAKAKDQPLNNKPGELQKNVAKIDAAVKKLRALEEEFDKLAEIERDLMELSRLAQQAKRLADQAQQLDDMLKDPPEGETPQQKQAREDAIAIRQQQLKNRHQDLTDQLDDLLKRRPELLDAARKQQLDKLAELSRKALELAEPQDKLGDALKKESQQAAQQAANLAKQQQQLAKQAEKLAADAEAAGKKAAVTPLDPEALRKAVDALKKGDLKAALDRQQAAAKELERLAGELQKNQTLPADPQKAAEELAKRQRQLNKDVDALAKKPSQADADPQQKSQFQQEMRKLAARQAGIQVGVAQLNAPRKNHAEQQDAVNKAADSVQKLLAAKPQDAAKAGKQTHDALQKLAKNIGSKQQRKAAALKTVEQLRKQQDRLAGQVANQTRKEKQGQSTKATADELQKLNKQQEQIARKVADLDAPDAEQTQQHALRKQAAAMLDLQNRRTQDADASQQQA